MARPAIAHPRLSRDGHGLVVHELKRAFRDGTTEFCCTGMYECRGRQDAESGLFEPLELMVRVPVRHPSGGLRPSESAVLPIRPRALGRPRAPPAPLS
jgi:hypothetical protein